MATREELEAQIAALEQALEDLPRGWKNQRERRIRSEQREEARRHIGVIQSQIDTLARAEEDPSAKRLGTPSQQKPVADMGIDELIEKLRGYTFRGGVGTGSITAENLDDSIIVREALIKAVNDEIERQEALSPTTAKGFDERKQEVERLEDIRDGKRSAISIPTPFGAGQEGGGLRIPILPGRDAPPLVDQQRLQRSSNLPSLPRPQNVPTSKRFFQQSPNFALSSAWKK